MRHMLVAAVCLAGLAAPAVAQARSDQIQEPQTQRVLYVCEATPQTRRAFRIEHGRVVYMTAEEVLAAQTRAERWQEPRCITAAELERLETMRTTRAGA